MTVQEIMDLAKGVSARALTQRLGENYVDRDIVLAELRRQIIAMYPKAAPYVTISLGEEKDGSIPVIFSGPEWAVRTIEGWYGISQ